MPKLGNTRNSGVGGNTKRRLRAKIGSPRMVRKVKAVGIVDSLFASGYIARTRRIMNSQTQKQYADMEATRFQNKKSGDAGGAKKSTDAFTQRKVGATVVGTRRRKGCPMDWVLDTATDVHE
ncbi:unnamed protein product [Phytophthora fragariaefolia]|uniref:Unnamed protein product n=1 Tax=Phytophthora fragariaefolia TaxID=1490495 RepID=A0A9W7D1Q3_9STRA|nr:unnamed protein product [Phytophthora fragariaefolia]